MTPSDCSRIAAVEGCARRGQRADFLIQLAKSVID